MTVGGRVRVRVNVPNRNYRILIRRWLCGDAPSVMDGYADAEAYGYGHGDTLVVAPGDAPLLLRLGTPFSGRACRRIRILAQG